MIIARDKTIVNDDKTSWIFYDDSCLIWEIQYSKSMNKFRVISGPIWWTASVITPDEVKTKLGFLREEDLKELNEGLPK